MKGNPLIDHDVRIDITPEPLSAKPKGERPSSEKQEAEVMRLQQILNKMKKQEQKIYSIEKAIVKLEKDLKEVKKKWFHKKEQKELESSTGKGKRYTGFNTGSAWISKCTGSYKGNEACKSGVEESSDSSKSMGCTGTTTRENVFEDSGECEQYANTGCAEKYQTEKKYS